MSDESNELTPEEREAFARLERTVAFDPLEEERTVRSLRAEGLLGAGSGAGSGAVGGTSAARGPGWPRTLRVGLAIAAGLACFLAGLWSERSGLWGNRNDSAAAPRTGARTQAALADAQVRSPIIRF